MSRKCFMAEMFPEVDHEEDVRGGDCKGCRHSARIRARWPISRGSYANLPDEAGSTRAGRKRLVSHED